VQVKTSEKLENLLTGVIFLTLGEVCTLEELKLPPEIPSVFGKI